jgi:Flp pilus assembly protein TadD
MASSSSTSFRIPLAAALSHTQKADVLLGKNQLVGALAEAQQAQSLAPDSAIVNDTLGHPLEANGRAPEARIYFEKALVLAHSVEPRFQETRLRVRVLEQRLAEYGE